MYRLNKKLIFFYPKYFALINCESEFVTRSFCFEISVICFIKLTSVIRFFVYMKHLETGYKPVPAKKYYPKYFASIPHAPSLETIHAPIGFSEVHFLLNSLQSFGSLSPRNISPHIHPEFLIPDS